MHHGSIANISENGYHPENKQSKKSIIGIKEIA